MDSCIVTRYINIDGQILSKSELIFNKNIIGEINLVY